MNLICPKSSKVCTYMAFEKMGNKNVGLCQALIKNQDCPNDYILSSLNFVKKPFHKKESENHDKFSFEEKIFEQLQIINAKLDKYIIYVIK